MLEMHLRTITQVNAQIAIIRMVGQGLDLTIMDIPIVFPATLEIPHPITIHLNAHPAIELRPGLIQALTMMDILTVFHVTSRIDLMNMIRGNVRNATIQI